MARDELAESWNRILARLGEVVAELPADEREAVLAALEEQGHRLVVPVPDPEPPRSD